MILNFTINGAVPSKKNNYRISGNKLYSPDETHAYVESFYYQFKNQRKNHTTIKGNVKLSTTFYIHHDKDLDNMLNTVMDALQSCKVIENDKNVVQIVAFKNKLAPGFQAHVDISLTSV